MGFDLSSSFDEPIFKPSSVEVKKLVIIAVEGAKTEHRYFSHIKSNFSELKKSIIEFELIKRDKCTENHSEPHQVVETITELIENPEQLKELKSNYRNFSDDYKDIFWIVIDREKVESRKQKIIETLKVCNDQNIKMSLINPTFEFWLLLHFDISSYPNEDLFKNEKISRNGKPFLARKLVDHLGSYKKSRYGTDFITKESINLAMVQEKTFENEVEKIIDNLGSNVGDLISEILEL